MVFDPFVDGIFCNEILKYESSLMDFLLKYWTIDKYHFKKNLIFDD